MYWCLNALLAYCWSNLIFFSIKNEKETFDHSRPTIPEGHRKNKCHCIRFTKSLRGRPYWRGIFFFDSSCQRSTYKPITEPTDGKHMPIDKYQADTHSYMTQTSIYDEHIYFFIQRTIGQSFVKRATDRSLLNKKNRVLLTNLTDTFPDCIQRKTSNRRTIIRDY